MDRILIWLTWIRIRIRNANPDPGANLPKFTNKPEFQAFKTVFVPTWECFMTYYLYKVVFLCKMTSKSDQDQDPHWSGSLEPDPVPP
jgi:hypothetical protein